MILNKEMKRILARGFTLVELLIVIALLGIIAVIVIAAINPIEQSNRARDAGYKADASQLLSAIERYYTSRGDFPWVVVSATGTSDAEYGFITAVDEEVGICGASCAVDGELINTLELKTEFRNRSFITKSPSDIFQSLFIGKDTGSSASVYACYVPLSKSNRDTGCANSSVYTLNTDGTRNAQACTSASTWPTSAAAMGNLWVVCVPD